MTCERCGYGRYMRSYPVEESTCFVCGHQYRSPEELREIAEIAQEPVIRREPHHTITFSAGRRARLEREYNNAYQRRRREKARR